LITIITNASASTTGLLDPGGAMSYNDTTYQTAQPFSGNTPFDTTPHCSGKGTSMNIFSSMPCPQLKINAEDVDGCNNISGCSWQNGTIFNLFRGCNGYVNLTAYNLNGSDETTYCALLPNISICENFGCTWISRPDQFNSQMNFSSNFNTVSIWESIAWVATLKFNFGFGSFINPIVNFMIFWIPMLALIVSIYFMFVPF
jgi:hypothetical protein